VIATLPLEEKFVIPAMDRGVPFLIQNKSHPVSRGIYDLAQGIKGRIVELEEMKEEAV
jgi:hypothetical protein